MYLIETFTLGPLQENTYLVYFPESRDALCIDPGADEPKLLGALAERGLTLRAILLSHGHVDHVAGAHWLNRRSGAPVALHSGDFFMLDDLPEFGQFFGYGALTAPRIHMPLAGGEKIQIGGYALEVLHTPGHSPGSVTYALDDNLFVGDLIFSGNVGRTDLPGGDPQALLDSIQQKIWPFPEAALIYPGHGERTTVGTEKRINPFVAVEP